MKPRIVPDYKASWACRHPQEDLRVMMTGETACDRCVSVVIRANGEPVVQPQPPRLVKFSLDEIEPPTPRESPREDLPLAAPLADVPVEETEPPLPEYPSDTDEKGTGEA
jgi:hypothetical protein